MKLGKIIAWRNWGMVRYNTVFQNAIALFYLALAYQQWSWSFLCQVAAFALLSLLGSSFGYLVNDFTDRDLDRRQGKSNVFARAAPAVAIASVAIAGALSLATSALFWSRPGFLLIYVAWLVTAACYSLPPLRLKVRGDIGLAATVAAQHTLPALLLFAAFGQLWSLETLILVVYITCRGVTSDASHQMRDWGNDVQSGARTAAVRHGYGWVCRLYAWSLEAEKLALGLVMLLLVLRLPAILLPVVRIAVPGSLPLLIIYLFLYCMTAGRALTQLAHGTLVDPHDPERQKQGRDVYQIIHHSFPSVAAPLYLALWLSIYFWPNIVFVVVLGLLFRLWSPQLWISIIRGVIHPSDADPVSG